MTKKRNVKSGCMPNTQVTYEDFENLLASFRLTLLPLKMGSRRDRKEFRKIEAILEGFAERHSVRDPELASESPRKSPNPPGRPVTFVSSRYMIGEISAFWFDCQIAKDPESEDGRKLEELRSCLYRILHRHGAITPKLRDGQVIGVADWLAPGNQPFAKLFDRMV